MIISDKNENANFMLLKILIVQAYYYLKKKFINTGMAHIDLNKKKIKCKVVNFNDFLKSNKIRYIDWLVIDAQGWI